MKTLNKILNYKNKNHFYPFFWQHGEDSETLTLYVDKIKQSGMNNLCVEARPHPDFLGQGWWHDMDLIMAKAKENDMKVWILDDSHFPTGFANGKVKESFPEFLKIYLNCRRYDIQGPFPNARIIAKYLKGRVFGIPNQDDKIIKIFLGKRKIVDGNVTSSVDLNSIIDITDKIDTERIIRVDVPEGAYSVFVLYETRDGGEEGTKDYLNPLIADATKVLIDEVYEKHYERYGEDFGKTIEAFFSDEPRFGNAKGVDAKIGSNMVLPWRRGLERELPFPIEMLPLLWVESEGVENEIRYQYMDLITRLYKENFTEVIGNWCKQHGVKYVGHTIEDNGAHARLGYGTGHFFRGQEGMHMAGIDVIGGHVVPGMDYYHDAFNTGGSNGEFFHYALAKLGASLAHLDPDKDGNCMCEAYGAYGWSEGLKTMKWITDHLIVRGVNYIVPHAFSPKEYPDWDCPPHFYAHGHNPQFRYFRYFTDYTNRLMNIFSNGHYPAKVGVLYPAMFEWSGDYMPIEKVTKELIHNQVSFDIISEDYLKDAKVENGAYKINNTMFESLVVPYGENMPKNMITNVMSLITEGVDVVFISEYPKQLKELPEVIKKTKLVSLNEVGEKLSKYKTLSTRNRCKDLVVGEYVKESSHFFMLFNESINNEITEIIDIKVDGNIYEYDAYSDTLLKLNSNGEGIKLTLSPYQSIVLIVSDQDIDVPIKVDVHLKTFDTDTDDTWNVSFADSFNYPNFTEISDINKLMCVDSTQEWDKKTGTLAFETNINVSCDYKKVYIDFGRIYEIGELFVNDQSVGVNIAPPYRYDVTNFIKLGKNKIRIEVTNTLGGLNRDMLSQYLILEPFGIEGKMEILIEA